MADPIIWPTAVLPPQSIMFARQSMSRSGGQSVSGVEQVVVSSTDRWQAKLTFRATRIEHAYAFRAMMAQADGRAGTWLIPTCSGFVTYIQNRWDTGLTWDTPGQTWDTLLRVPVGVRTYVNAPFSDGATFSDGGGFETKMVMGAVTVGANKGQRTITVQMQAEASPPIAGSYFSIGQSLYLIASSIPVNDDGSQDGPYAISFRPGLRAATAPGDVADFSKPACLMRLASDDTGQMTLDALRFSTVSLDFVEALPAS